MKKKIMWIVKREVLAESIEKAVHAKGRVYEIIEAEDKYQPQITKSIGFKK